jgi:hypothetical protein
MRVANDAAPTGAFQPYSSTIMWQLADLDGTRVVHAQLKDASGNTSEVVVDSIVLDRGAPHATVAPPTNPTANVAILFSETVTAVSSQNVVLRLVDTTVDLPATLTCRDAAMVVVSCATGLSVSVTLDPVAPLLPTRSYTVVINPSGRPPLTDEAGNAAIASSHPFNL